MTATRFDPDALAALEEQRDFLLGSLDDLEREREAGDIDERDYATLRDDYTARAAAVLRAIEARRPSAPPPSPRRWRRTLLGMALVAVLAVGAGLAVAASSGTRRPGEFGTGDIRESTVSRLREAERLAGDGQILDALRAYDEVLETDADNPQALTYKGWLLVSVGRSSDEEELLTRGIGLMEQAMDAHPDYPDAYFFYGFYLWRVEGDVDAAVASFQRVLANDPGPEMEAEARAALAQLRSGP